ncbi:hypothetical protein, variant [Aphanomyces invadans]|uniref:Prolyl 4-hydroxylase alpha subunit domain-containing protein n=1 Tax=Aphanomyces invadans TaxID=157072 RepID=A0A024UGJ4_9STRA|nr:hypothetical protein, variant [Aphanomyces invadans]ETW04977.1 hypothetical protein, variant [Aphanomyces invadans]|eukprot:XP_008866414.1 hypothetical protein, variant [Aphanomyces invadans]
MWMRHSDLASCLKRPPTTPIAARDVFPPERQILALVLDNVLSPLECEALIRHSEITGYEPALLNIGYGRQVLRTDVRNNDRCIIDDVVAATILWERVQPYLPDTYRGKPFAGVNERLRFLRYYPGQEFKPHYDGTYRRPDGSEQSYLTIQVYLNGGDDLQGGDTILFDRKEHSGAPVVSGVKYTIRSDIMCTRSKVE